jgi:hypothetical protein
MTEEQKNIAGDKAEQSPKGALQPNPEKPSDAKPQEPSQQAETTYTKEQLQNYTRDALMEQGRKHKEAITSLQRERDEARSKQGDTEFLQKQVDELTSKDPEVFNLAKKEKELREERSSLTKDKNEHAASIERVKNFDREVIIQRVVEEYEGADFGKLKGLCETFNAFSEDQIRTAADTLWSKAFNPPVSTVPAAPPALSGMTSGGRSFQRDPKNPDQTLAEGFRELKKK